MRDYSTPKQPGPKNQPIEPRFWRFVDKLPNGCWMWCGATMKNGYGTFSVNGRAHLAHRVSWELRHGPIPEGMQVLHNCPDGDSPDCVNPDHLFLGTNTDNMADKVAKGRQSRGDEINAPKGESDVRAIRRALASGETAENISQRYHVSRVAISKIKHDVSWKHLPMLPDEELPEAKPGLTNDDVRIIRAAHAEGLATMDVLAQHFGVGETTIWNIVHRVTRKNVSDEGMIIMPAFTSPKERESYQARGEDIHAVKGEAHHSAKLTEDDVRAIRRLHAEGLTNQAIATQYGVSQVSVSSIVLRKHWKHVD